MTDDSSLLAGTALDDDIAVEPKLRPQTLSEYIGQTKVCENLSVFLAAARARGEPLDHVLLTGARRAAHDGGPHDLARRGSCRNSDEPAAQGRPLCRRDPSPRSAGRGDPLP